MRLFLDSISVNPFLLEDGVKKYQKRCWYFFASSETRQCKLLGLCQNIHPLSVNRFNGGIMWYVFDHKNKSGDDRTKLECDRQDQF